MTIEVDIGTFQDAMKQDEQQGANTPAMDKLVDSTKAEIQNGETILIVNAARDTVVAQAEDEEELKEILRNYGLL